MTKQKQVPEVDFGKLFDEATQRTIIGLNAYAMADLWNTIKKYDVDSPEVKEKLRKYNLPIKQLDALARSAGINLEEILMQMAVPNLTEPNTRDKKLLSTGSDNEEDKTRTKKKKLGDYITVKKFALDLGLGVWDAIHVARFVTARIKTNKTILTKYAHSHSRGYLIDDISDARKLLQGEIEEWKKLPRDQRKAPVNYSRGPYKKFSSQINPKQITQEERFDFTQIIHKYVIPPLFLSEFKDNLGDSSKSGDGREIWPRNQVDNVDVLWKGQTGEDWRRENPNWEQYFARKS